MSAEELKPLLTVLGEIGFHHRKAVLMQGRKYWRIEELIKQARHDLKSGSGEDKAALSAEAYWWEVGGDKRIVVWIETPGGRRPAFAEPGSFVFVAEG